MFSAKLTIQAAAVSCLTLLTVGILFPNCSTKVGNPGNDNDQTNQQDGALLSMPQITKNFELPKDFSALDKVDPAYQGVIKDILAVGYIASTIPASLSEFFAALAERKFLENQTFSIEDQGRTLTGKTWTVKSDDGVVAGVWFCEGSRPLAHMTWGDTGRKIVFTRDLSVPLLIADDPLVSGLDGKTTSIVAPDGTSLESFYTGQKRDPVTLELKDIRAVMQYSALVQPNGSYTFQGSGSDQDDPTQVPTSGEIKAYGNFAADASGEILLHLQGLCPDFQEGNPDAPKWCLHSKFNKEGFVISDGNPDEKWKTLRSESVPLPTHDRLKIVGFPPEMTCP